MPQLIRGQHVRIRALNTSDDWCEAIVVVISNGPAVRSVELALECMVRAGDGFIGGDLPLFVDFEQETVKGLDDQEYEIEVADAAID
jgi:hypothetical protein